MAGLAPDLAERLRRYLNAVATQRERRDAESPPAPRPAVTPPPPAPLTGLALTLAPYARFVVHKHRERAGDFYVGRPTLWGNPFRLTNPADDEQREACVLAYARHFAQRSKRQQLYMLAPIRRIIVAEGGRLVCFCAPRLCHAQAASTWALGHGQLVNDL